MHLVHSNVVFYVFACLFLVDRMSHLCTPRTFGAFRFVFFLQQVYTSRCVILQSCLLTIMRTFIPPSCIFCRIAHLMHVPNSHCKFHGPDACSLQKTHMRRTQHQHSHSMLSVHVLLIVKVICSNEVQLTYFMHWTKVCSTQNTFCIKT